MSEKNIELLTIEKVSEILHISKQKINALIKNGELPAIVIGPRSRRISADDLSGYIKKSKKVGQL